MKVKQLLADGRTASMVMVSWPHPSLIEHLGALGFDLAMIDCEKGGATVERIEEMCRAGRAAGIATIVRPWTPDPGLISRYLDLGADGVMVAGVETPQAARAVVEAVRYARWKDYAEKLVIAMIESPEAIARLPELLAVEGVDVWFIGPNDLAHRMGMPGQASRPEVRTAVAVTLHAIHAAGRIGGTLTTGGDALALQSAGARLLLCRAGELLADGAKHFRAQLATTDTTS